MTHFYSSELPREIGAPIDYDWPDWAGPTPVMAQALALVQADLDVAGLGHFQLSYAIAGEIAGELGVEPIINVQWRGTWTSDGIDLDSDNLAEVTVDVAAQTAQGLVELEGVYWPTCPGHGVRAQARIDHRHEAVWECQQRGSSPHTVARIGGLGSTRSGRPSKNAHRRKDGPLWRTLKELARP